MTAPTHVLIGLSGVVCSGYATGILPTPLGIFAVIVGSLAPDIDGDGSITKPGFLLKAIIGKRLANLLDIVVEPIAKLVKLTLGHRGFLHAPLLSVVLLAIGGLGQVEWLYWFGFGYALHIYGDYMTFAGVPVFSPFSNRNFSGSKMRVGSKQEKRLAALLLIALCIAGWPLLPEPVKDTHRALLQIGGITNLPDKLSYQSNDFGRLGMLSTAM